MVGQRRPLEVDVVVREDGGRAAAAANRQVVDVRRTGGEDDVVAGQAGRVDDRLSGGRAAEGEDLTGERDEAVADDQAVRDRVDARGEIDRVVLTVPFAVSTAASSCAAVDTLKVAAPAAGAAAPASTTTVPSSTSFLRER
jgi:hypothetical protein